MPQKNNVTHQIFGWQKEIFDALWDSKRNIPNHKLLAILKARGIGASEILMRYALWRILRNDEMQGKNVAVITGIRENLSLELLNRFRNLLPNFDWETGPSSNVAEINGCRVIGYPSKRTKDLRGLTDCKLAIADEFAFFDPVDQQQILPVLEAFRQKSDCQVILLSTPGPLNDVYHKLFSEPVDQCRYHRIYIPWQKMYDTLLSESELQEAKKQPNFPQEFELRFGFFNTTGTIFSLADIDNAVKLGKQFADPNYNPDCLKRPYPSTIYGENKGVVLSVDPGGAGSKFAICGLQIWNGKCHIFYASEFERPDQTEMVELILKLWLGTHKRANIFVDSAASLVINSLKSEINRRYDNTEQVDVNRHLEYIRKYNFLAKDYSDIGQNMIVCPISFNAFGPKLLQTAAAYIQRNWVAIHPSFSELISQLQSAKVKDNASHQWGLEKTASQSMDLVDAFRMCMFNMQVR